MNLFGITYVFNELLLRNESINYFHIFKADMVQQGGKNKVGRKLIAVCLSYIEGQHPGSRLYLFA